MNVAKEKVISVSYELRATDGELIEQVASDQPFQFLYGTGHMIPMFEEKLVGMTEGSDFDFMIASDDAYGPVNADSIVDLAVDMFKRDGVLEEGLLVIGNNIPMQDAQGNRFNGIVKELNGEMAKMDFNHPLAGVDLHFKGKVEAIREATEEELSHGHLHGADGGCGSGGCGCDSNNDGSCDTPGHGQEEGCGCESSH